VGGKEDKKDQPRKIGTDSSCLQLSGEGKDTMKLKSKTKKGRGEELEKLLKLSPKRILIFFSHFEKGG